MKSYTWAEMEDAVLTALQTQLGDQVKTLRTYQGNWQEDLKRQVWRLPAVLVMIRENSATQVSMGSYDLSVHIQILVADRQWRGEEVARRGEGGVYHLLQEVRAALWHSDLGLDILPLTLLREEPLLATEEWVVFGAHYHTVMIQDFESQQ